MHDTTALSERLQLVQTMSPFYEQLKHNPPNAGNNRLSMSDILTINPFFCVRYLSRKD